MHIAPDLQLPSLPEVTLRALDACHQDESYRKISEIVSADTALVARILALANSALYGPSTPIRSVDQALLRLGTRRFHTLVLTAALRQLLFELGGDEWQQLRDFWRHSLTTALTARALATLTRYPEPDEAFMLGMLHNIGELIAIKTPATDTKQHYLDHQSDIAAELVASWGLGPMAADAMRYQQALPSELRDAGHLVKLISLATRLALSDAAGIAAAGTVFGLNEELTREINRRIGHEVSGMAASLGIPLDEDYCGESASRQLKQTILRQAMANQAINLADLTGETEDILAETVNSLTLVTGLPALCFGHSGDNLVLLSGTIGDIPELAVTAKPAAVFSRKLSFPACQSVLANARLQCSTGSCSRCYTRHLCWPCPLTVVAIAPVFLPSAPTTTTCRQPLNWLIYLPGNYLPCWPTARLPKRVTMVWIRK